MKIEKFEDLPLWQGARDLSNFIYTITDKKSFSDNALKFHIRKTVISIISNIAEGFERGSNKEFIQFLFVAKGSIGELRSQLYIAADNKFIDRSDFDKALSECLSLSRQTSKFTEYLRKSEITNSRHKTR